MERDHETAAEALEGGAVIAAVEPDTEHVVVWFGPPGHMLHLYSTAEGEWRELDVRTLDADTVDYDLAVIEGRAWLAELLDDGGDE